MRYALDFQMADLLFCGDEVLKQQVVKHSKNIIDLIEVGDIVRILLNEKTGATTLFHFESQKQIDILKETNTHIIVSIVTKEQYKSVEYVF